MHISKYIEGESSEQLPKFGVETMQSRFFLDIEARLVEPRQHARFPIMNNVFAEKEWRGREKKVHHRPPSYTQINPQLCEMFDVTGKI